MNSITYEIHLLGSEILADNLTFEEIPELFQAYEEWYGDGQVVACYRQHHDKPRTLKTNLEEFREDWNAYMDYLITIDNI